MRRIRIVSRLAGSCALVGLLVSCNRDCRTVADLDLPPQPGQVYDAELPDAAKRFAVIGDLQRTSYFECIDGREVNDHETQRLVAALLEDDPEFIVIVGDLVFDGSSEEHWRLFDTLFARVRASHLAVLPLLGNHELWGSDNKALEHLAIRFPRLRAKTYYADRTGLLGLIWLDTNRRDPNLWREQAQWYDRQLASFEADPKVRAILVFAHHPPLTRSPWVDGSEDVRTTFLPGFLGAPKAVALLTGHAHGYEHYEREGKHLVITAGGGGPRPTKLEDPPQGAWREVYSGPAPRPFNYVLVRAEAQGVELRVRGLQKGDSQLKEIERIVLAWPRKDGVGGSDPQQSAGVVIPNVLPAKSARNWEQADAGYAQCSRGQQRAELGHKGSQR